MAQVQAAQGEGRPQQDRNCRPQHQEEGAEKGRQAVKRDHHTTATTSATTADAVRTLQTWRSFQRECEVCSTKNGQEQGADQDGR
jgi:hypothetical protein